MTNYRQNGSRRKKVKKKKKKKGSNLCLTLLKFSLHFINPSLSLFILYSCGHWIIFCRTDIMGKFSNLCTPHSEYLTLGVEPLERQKNYRALFVHHVDGELLEEIRANTNKGMAV